MEDWARWELGSRASAEPNAQHLNLAPSSLQTMRTNVPRKGASTGMNEASHLIREKSLWHLASVSVYYLNAFLFCPLLYVDYNYHTGRNSSFFCKSGIITNEYPSHSRYQQIPIMPELWGQMVNAKKLLEVWGDQNNNIHFLYPSSSPTERYETIIKGHSKYNLLHSRSRQRLTPGHRHTGSPQAPCVSLPCKARGGEHKATWTPWATSTPRLSPAPFPQLANRLSPLLLRTTGLRSRQAVRKAPLQMSNSPLLSLLLMVLPFPWVALSVIQNKGPPSTLPPPPPSITGFHVLSLPL